MITRKNPFFFWAHGIHKTTLFGVFGLLIIGLLLSFSLSYSASEKIGLKSLSFFLKHITFTFVAVFIILTLSSLPAEKLKWFALFCFFFVILALIGTFFFPGIKGAKRWINLAGFSLQPSEFLKPFYIYIFSLLFTNIEIFKIKNEEKKNRNLTFLLFFLQGIITFLLFLQPDFGMILTFTFLFLSCFYINLKSIRKFFLGCVLILGLAAAIGSSLSHVQHRVKTFFFGLENYQSKLAIKAIQNGGFFGKGITESQLKFVLPEAHNDFIFAILIEEFGFIFAGILGLIFIVIIFSNFLYIFDFKEKLVRMFAKIDTTSKMEISTEEAIEEVVKKNYNLKTISGKNYLNIYYDFIFCRNFIFLTCILLFFEFFLNVSVSLDLVPTKGIAMPFISYGGSSLVSHGFLIGFLLAFNKKRYFFLV